MFILSKIAELLILPSIVLTLGCLLGLLLVGRWPRIGRRLALTSLCVLLLVGLLPIGEMLIRP
jgi:hypothetical protein